MDAAPTGMVCAIPDMNQWILSKETRLMNLHGGVCTCSFTKQSSCACIGWDHDGKHWLKFRRSFYPNEIHTSLFDCFGRHLIMHAPMVAAKPEAANTASMANSAV